MADFQALSGELEAEQISIVAASVDPLEKAKQTVERLGITFPVAYGMDAEEVSRVTGAYYDSERKIIHATGFLIRPEGTVEVACYSTGPVGRLVARDVLGLVKFYKSRKKS